MKYWRKHIGTLLIIIILYYTIGVSWVTASLLNCTICVSDKLLDIFLLFYQDDGNDDNQGDDFSEEDLPVVDE